MGAGRGGARPDDGGDAEKPLLEKLGPHTTGVACLYLKKLDGVDLDVLRELVAGAWRRWSQNGTIATTLTGPLPPS